MTTNAPYAAATLAAEAFNCPSCGAFSSQWWSDVMFWGGQGTASLGGWKLAICRRCRNPSFWLEDQMVYPSGGNAPLPNSDLPPDIQNDYEEARAILNRSPRGAAALLRLAIQKLCKVLGERGDNINDDIASLVRNGLLPGVQQALDAVRVIGNHAVHPGQIDLQDQPDTAAALFLLVNLIADQMLTAPKQAKAVYDALPQNLRDAIARRDGAPR